jgi:hypothetical protein
MRFRFLALPLIAAGVLGAQGPGPHGNSLTPPTPAQALQRQVDFLTKFYSLTTTPTNQVSEVTTILSTEQSCLPAPGTLQTARQGLATAVKGGVAGVADAVTALTKVQAEEELCHATAAAGIWAILDPTTQQIKGIGPLLGAGGRGPGPGFHHGPPPKQ